MLVRNAGRLEYTVDDQDWSAKRLCLRARAGIVSAGAYVLVEVDDGDPTTVAVSQRPILPFGMDPFWRGPTQRAVARIEGLLGDDGSFP